MLRKFSSPPLLAKIIDPADPMALAKIFRECSDYISFASSWKSIVEWLFAALLKDHRCDFQDVLLDSAWIGAAALSFGRSQRIARREERKLKRKERGISASRLICGCWEKS
jgi:hypothetical protein